MQAGNFIEYAIIHIDYKMKLDPIGFREKTNDFYATKCTSWSGAVLIFKKSKDEDLVCGKKRGNNGNMTNL